MSKLRQSKLRQGMQRQEGQRRCSCGRTLLAFQLALEAFELPPAPLERFAAERLVAEKSVLKSDHCRFENARDRGLAARLAEVLPVGLALGQTDEMALVELDELVAEEIDDRRRVLALLVQAAGLGEKIARGGAEVKGQGLDAVGVAAALDNLAHGDAFRDFVFEERGRDEIGNQT